MSTKNQQQTGKLHCQLRGALWQLFGSLRQELYEDQTVKTNQKDRSNKKPQKQNSNQPKTRGSDAVAPPGDKTNTRMAWALDPRELEQNNWTK
ncbi:hypothetical protein REPUB_Repub20aG0023200 [Reevesia pubescens]